MAILWHPFTQHALADEETLIVQARGAMVMTRDGREVIDGISSWWVTTHGHCHPAIVHAVQEQAAQLDQVLFAGFTHAPAEQLAEELLAFAPCGWDHVFLSDSGSTAVEVALKMAVGFHAHHGTPRHTIVALEHGYHGDTFGAMAVGASSVFNAIYSPLLFQVERLPFPHHPEKTIEAFKALCARQGDSIAALILEPLVLGAGGMKMYEPRALTELAVLCKAHGILLIADEVMTGFGRTGTRFACQQAAVTPDIMCLSKGITGGCLPLGATLCSAAIYDAFYKKDKVRTFWHSSSYTGNVLACAAALANLRVWRDEHTDDKIAGLTAMQTAQLHRLKGHSLVRNPRQCGTIVAFEVGEDEQGYLSSLAQPLCRFLLNQGVLLRPLGNTLYVLPPYCIRQDELSRITDGMIDALDAIRDGTIDNS